MAGLVLAGTTQKHRIERLVLPLRDAFAALFFFHFGLIIDPGEIGAIIVPASAAVVMSLVLALVAAVGRGANQQPRPARRGQHRLLRRSLAASSRSSSSRSQPRPDLMNGSHRSSPSMCLLSRSQAHCSPPDLHGCRSSFLHELFPNTQLVAGH